MSLGISRVSFSVFAISFFPLLAVNRVPFSHFNFLSASILLLTFYIVAVVVLIVAEKGSGCCGKRFQLSSV